MRIVESLRKSLLLGTQSEDLFCNPPHYLSFLQTMILSHFQSSNHTLLFNYIQTIDALYYYNKGRLLKRVISPSRWYSIELSHRIRFGNLIFREQFLDLLSQILGIIAFDCLGKQIGIVLLSPD